MLTYLLAHPELSFSPPDMAALCEAFDMAIAELQEREGNSVNWTIDSARTALAAVIVTAWRRGEHDPKRLADHAVKSGTIELARSDR